MQVGTKPGPGFRLPDGTWLNGLSNGQNLSYLNGVVAHAGGTKAAAFQLPAAVALIEVDTVAADHDSCLLPQAAAGVTVEIFNSGAHVLDLYGQGTDTVNNAATANAYSLNANQSATFACAKDGSWFATKSA